jgi:hypothetical protein
LGVFPPFFINFLILPLHSTRHLPSNSKLTLLHFPAQILALV